MSAREVWRRIVPSRTIPRTRWRNEGSRWRTRPSTVVVLVLGLWLFGTGEALLVDAGLGNAPWTVFARGISVRSGIAIGLATFLISVIVLLLWIPLRERPGLGTVANRPGKWALPHHQSRTRPARRSDDRNP
ncbi:MAG: hypothetical protein ACKOQ4_12410 [Mycobacterium sp.]